MGIDADPAGVERARAEAKAASAANANFEIGDAYALPVLDGSADAVFEHSVLEALDQPADALSEERRVLSLVGSSGFRPSSNSADVLHGMQVAQHRLQLRDGEPAVDLVQLPHDLRVRDK